MALNSHNQVVDTGGKGKKKRRRGKAANTTHITSPAHWTAVKIALIRSIRDGIFFDRKYWARHSKAGDILKPVYFSSIVMEDKAQQLKNRVSKFTHRYTKALMIPSGKVR